jgi:hypothetical protein
MVARMSSMRILVVDGWRIIIAAVYAITLLVYPQGAVPFGFFAVLMSLSVGEGKPPPE